MVSGLHYLYCGFLVTGVVILLGTGIDTHRREQSNFSRIYLMLVLAASVYLFGYAMELISRTTGAVVFWARFQYVGIPFITSVYFLMTVYYTTSEKKVNRLFLIGLAVCSLGIFTARVTNSLHHLFFRDFDIVDYGTYLSLTVREGPFFLVAEIYYMLCIFASLLVLIFFYLRVSRAYRRQAGLLILGTLLYIPTAVAVTAGLIRPPVDIMPIIIVVNGILLLMAISRHRLISLVPVAREHVMDMMIDGVIVVDHQNRVADANPIALDMFVDDRQDPVGRPIDEACPLIGNYPESGRKIHHNDRIWELSVMRISRKAGAYEGTVVFIRDVTDREQLVDRLEHLAHIDELTGLMNRRSWESAVRVEMSRLSRYRHYGSFIYLDLDHFKVINDTHGHAAGDCVLQKTGEILAAAVRHPDLVGRLGGEEFGLFLPESTPQDAAETAERLRIILADGLRTNSDIEFNVTGSFGVSGCVITRETTLEDLVSTADKAMYKSKQSGRNRVSVSNSCIPLET